LSGKLNPKGHANQQPSYRSDSIKGSETRIYLLLIEE